MVKAVAFFKRRTGMDGPVPPVDDFRRHWREVHGRGREPRLGRPRPGVGRRRRRAAVTLVAIVSGAVIAHACTGAEQNRLRDELPRLTSWQAVYASFRAYTPRCDDGWMAEGYTEAFVLRHVDGSADLDELRAVFSNATRRCPGELRALCRSLATAATEALKG